MRRTASILLLSAVLGTSCDDQFDFDIPDSGAAGATMDSGSGAVDAAWGDPDAFVTGDTCEPRAHVCIRRCQDDHDCRDPELACASRLGLCFACKGHEECEHGEGLRFCMLGEGGCRSCLTDQDCR